MNAAAWLHSCANCGHVYGETPPYIDQACPGCGSWDRCFTPKLDADRLVLEKIRVFKMRFYLRQMLRWKEKRSV